MTLIEKMSNTIGGQLRAFVEEQLGANRDDFRTRVDMFSNSITSRKLVLPKGVTLGTAYIVAALIEEKNDWNVPVKKVIVRTCGGTLNGGKIALTVKLESN